MDEVTLIDSLTGEEKSMHRRYASVYVQALPNRYMTRELRADTEGPVVVMAPPELRRKPGRPRKAEGASK